MYLLHGNLIAKQGHQKELADILMKASKLIATADGCKLYAVGTNADEPNGVYVTEIWDNKESHDNSLNIPGVRELIMQAMPILGEQPKKGQEIEILGGYGV